MPSFFAHNPLNSASSVPATSLPVARAASAPIGLDPLFGRPKWTYVNILKSPVFGPDPRLAKGTGRTGDPALPGNSPQLPGYLSDTAYFPSLDDYAPVHEENNALKVPKSIGTGDDGRQLVGTYVPHDFTPAQRFFQQNRSAYNWQVQSFPPNTRNLLYYQQVQKYNLASVVQQARPLGPNNYFLGYQVDPAIQAAIGQTGNGWT
jgi:hypothetical protein